MEISWSLLLATVQNKVTHAAVATFKGCVSESMTFQAINVLHISRLDSGDRLAIPKCCILRYPEWINCLWISFVFGLYQVKSTLGVSS